LANEECEHEIVISGCGTNTILCVCIKCGFSFEEEIEGLASEVGMYDE
jgi:hypothetical protein